MNVIEERAYLAAVDGGPVGRSGPPRLVAHPPDVRTVVRKDGARGLYGRKPDGLPAVRRRLDVLILVRVRKRLFVEGRC